VDPAGASPIDVLPIGVVALELDLTLAWASNTAIGMLGGSPGEPLGASVLDLIHPDDVGRAAGLVGQLNAADFLSPSAALHVETPLRLQHADGRWVSFGVTGRLVGPEGPIVVSLRPNAVDQELVAILRGLAVGHGAFDLTAAVVRLLSAQFGGRAAWFVYDVDAEAPVMAGEHRLPGPVVREALDATRDHEVHLVGDGAYWAMAVHEFDRVLPTGVLLLDNPRGNGPPQAYDLEILVRAADVASLVLGRIRTDEALRQAASTDPLTGLANRAALEEAVAALGPADFPVGVVYVDLDGFKQVNDALGHAMGDEVLRVTARRVRARARSGEVVARLGGDEFVVLCRRVDDDALRQVAVRIRAALREPWEHRDVVLSCQASVGEAIAADDEDLVSLFERADRAMYDEKRRAQRLV
jgi:diguanylate cyclase (GGDEF)-like protein